MPVVEVLRWDELVRRADSYGRARTLVRRGTWARVLRDAYVPGAEDLRDPAVRAAAAARVLPGGAALSHRSALWVLGDDVLRHGLLDVTVPRGQHLVPRPGLRTHIAALPLDHLVVVDGLLVVSAARATVDVLRGERLQDGVAFGDRALRLGAATEAGLARVLDESGGLRGVRQARRGFELLDGRAESWRESVLRVALREGGVRGLDVQHDVYDDEGHVGRADLHVQGAWLEYDGREAHLDRRTFVAERRRQTAAAELGFEVRRFTSADVDGRSAASLAAEVLRAVALARGRRRDGVRTGPDTLRPPRLVPQPTLARSLRAA